MIFFVRCTFKNEKEYKGGIIACTQRAGSLVIVYVDSTIVISLQGVETAISLMKVNVCHLFNKYSLS